MKDVLAWGIIVLAGAVMLIALIGAAWLYGSATCGWSTSGMTLPHRYKFGAGCQVQTKDAGWIGLEHFRVIQ